MFRTKSLFGLWMASIFSLATHSAHASEVSVSGRLQSISPTYYTAVDGQFSVWYQNAELPWGVRVFLNYGFERSEFQNGDLVPKACWQDASEMELFAVGPYQWQGHVQKQLYSRGSSWQLSALQFYIKIIFADGSVVLDRGAGSDTGFYHVTRPTQSRACEPFGSAMCDLAISLTAVCR